jgi:hypothetical protein
MSVTSLDTYRHVLSKVPDAAVGTWYVALALVAYDFGYSDADDPTHDEVYRRYYEQYRSRHLTACEVLALIDDQSAGTMVVVNTSYKNHVQGA